MDFAKVSVEIRNQSGKGPARRSRSAGKLPAVLYGHKLDPLSLTLDPVELVRALDKDRKRNTVFTLQVKDAAKPEDVTAMIRDVQIDPLSRRPVHVDFIRVSMDEEVKVSVPIAVVGIAVGTTNGGNLHLSHHTLPIAAKPDAIPTKVDVDVTALDIGDALHASDLKLPAGVRTTLDPKEAVASVVAPHAGRGRCSRRGCGRSRRWSRSPRRCRRRQRRSPRSCRRQGRSPRSCCTCRQEGGEEEVTPSAGPGSSDVARCRAWKSRPAVRRDPAQRRVHGAR